jgi:hypothetical protein
MAIDPRLIRMKKAFELTISKPPAGRIVLLVARVWLRDAASASEVGVIPAQDPGARGKGGAPIDGLRFHKPSLKESNLLEIATWNTGKPSNLQDMANPTHAERQLCEFLNTPNKERYFSSIEVELTHSPCTACCAMLEKLKFKNPGSSASLRWIEPYEIPPQATRKDNLEDLMGVGWELSAPATGLPLSPAKGFGERWSHNEIGRPGMRIKSLDVKR